MTIKKSIPTMLLFIGLALDHSGVRAESGTV